MSWSRALAAMRRPIDCLIATRAALPQKKCPIEPLVQPQEPAITWLACCTALTMV